MLTRVSSFLWIVSLVFIFLRPFISEYAFLSLGFWYNLGLIFVPGLYLISIHKEAKPRSFLHYGVILFFLAVLLSMVIKGFTLWSLYELYLFIPNLLIFYTASSLKPNKLKQLIVVLLFAASIIGIYAVYQYFIGLGHTAEYLKQNSPNQLAEEFLSRRRTFATFISPNIFASYVAMMFFVGMGFLIGKRQTPRVRLLSGVSILLMAAALLLTKSIGGVLSFSTAVFIFVFCAFFYLTPQHGLKKFGLRKLTFAVVIILFVFSIAAGFLSQKRIQQSFSKDNSGNNSVIQRGYYWQASVDMIKKSPLFGVGWRKFGLSYGSYKPAQANMSHYSHNVFLQIAAETGLLGLFSFAWVTILFFISALRSIRIDDELQGLKIGLFCAACVFLIHNFVDLSFYFGQVSFFWWMILGIFA